MNILLILSILFIIIWYGIYTTEGFEEPPIDPKIEEKYQKFMSFYNPFLTDWEKAVVTSIGLDTPVKPLTDPSQTSSATFQTPTRIEMNNHIKKMEKMYNTSFPPLTDPLPTTLTPTLMSDMMQHVSMDPAIYQNALQFMVKNQADAHTQLDAMKKSPEGFDSMNPYWNIEGFDSCADYKKCATDPEVLDAIAKAQEQQQSRAQKQKENDFENKLDKFNMNTVVPQLSAQNKEYMQKALEIQEKAKNGTLLNEFNLSNNDTSLDHFIKPQGVYNLEQMKKDNPEQYAEYEKKNANIMGVAGLFNSISNTLAGK